MEMKEVTSSNIAKVGHDDRSTLRVQFKNGSVWDYADVDRDTYRSMVHAASIGSFFHQHIKSEKVGTPVTEDEGTTE